MNETLFFFLFVFVAGVFDSSECGRLFSVFQSYVLQH